MEFTYRGHRYQTSEFPVEEYGTASHCRYRGASYQLKRKRAMVTEAPQPVGLTYRGVSYIRTP
ncbi:DUF4278 domain-containing protein [Vacuolonema iberomarrocanum]|uniref:DUF4278 domain-containing protein n=1 Tax=Vacuolonema iberomarrocanum TaxID=3454632 RepID=UPI001A1031F0|nr:DUF4278 domain-containing protein [filamentous cyanobacterium LEGE 07170]